MSSMFDTAIQAGLDSVRSITGVSVTYSQGDVASNAITAGVGSTTFEIDDGETIVETWTSRDYFIKAADLVVNGVTVTPIEGDKITEGVKTYEVMAPHGKQVAEFSDRSMTRYRIHTKEVA